MMQSHMQMKSEITQAVQEASIGSKKVKVTFKDNHDAVLGAINLISMVESGIIQLDHKDRMVIDAVSHVRDFSKDHNRVITIVLGEAFSESWFAKRMCKAIQEIQVIPN